MADRTVSVALQLKILGFTGPLRQAQQQVKGFNDNLGRNTSKNKAALDDLSRGFGTVGLAAGAGLGLAVKKFADFDKAMSGVRAATHETAGNLQLLRDAAIDAGAKTAFSATEAAGAIENLAKAGVSTRDILGGGLAGALDLAAAGELAVADAAETAATAMTQFGLSGKEVPHVADLLAAAAGKAQGEVSHFAQALNQSGLVAAQMGLSIEETTGTLAAFAAAGLLGSDAGTSFKTMLLRLANPSKEAAGTMKELGVHAYDAQGAFVGIAPLAEQLKGKLGNLSQQQRDTALATIFGSDAIRAANVLFTNGAKGIAEWTTKVNDAGFAAETAAIKQDNLRGDLEKLGGAFETALIQAGSGANDVLRKITQTAGAAVDGFSKLPQEVQAGAAALASIVAIGGLGTATLLKVASAAGEARESWQNLGRTGRTLTLSMGAVGVALTAAAAIYGVLAKRNAEATRRVDELRSTLDQQTGAITGNTRAYVSNEFAQNGLAQKAKDLGLNLALMTDAALGNSSALDAMVGVLDRTIEAGRTAEIIANELHPAFTAEAKAAKEIKDALVGTNKSLTDAQLRQRLAAEGAKEHETAQSLQAAAVKKANEQIKQQTADLKEQTEAAFKAAGQALALRDAENQYHETLAAVNGALKDNGRTLNVATEKGRANRETLDAIATAANDLTESMLANGRGHDTARKQAEQARAKFVDVAVRMGLNKKAAKDLAAELIAIPPKAHTAVTNTAPAAKAQVVDYRRNGLGAIPATVPTRITPVGVPAAKETLRDYRTHGLGAIPGTAPTRVTTVGVEAAKRSMTGYALHVDKTLGGIADESINIGLHLFSKGLGGRPPVERATGGPIYGPGTETSDSIPARLSRGEHVITAREVRGAGGHGAVMAMRAEWAHGFAAGGAVDTRLLQSSNNMSAVAATVARTLGKEIVRQLGTEGGPPGPPGNVRSFRGHRLNERTIGMLLSAERILGRAFHVTQGSYSTRVAASGGTHAGGGAMDTNGPGGWGAAVAALRRVGFAAWRRTPSQGPWGHHIHSIAIGDPSASAAAKAQVRDYKRGGDGLHGMAQGGPAEDPMLIRAHRGEFVVNRAATERNRALLEAINAPAFAKGGIVGGRRVISRHEDGSIVFSDSTAFDPETGQLRRVSVETMLRELAARKDLRKELEAYKKAVIAAAQRAIPRLQSAIDKTVTGINTSVDRLRSLVEQRTQFGQQVTSSTSRELFGDGSIVGLRNRLSQDAADASGFQRSLSLLRTKGLTPDLWNELAGSSDFLSAEQLAKLPAGELAAINAAFKKRQQANASLAAFAGNARFGDAIRTEQARIKSQQSLLKGLQAVLKRTHFKITLASGKNFANLQAYDTGGVLLPGQAGVNLSGRPERVLSPQQTIAFDRLVAALERNASGPQVFNIIDRDGQVLMRFEAMAAERDRRLANEFQLTR